MKKNLLLVASLFLGAVAFAQNCAAVASVNENFSTFTITSASTEAFPQKCWSSLGVAEKGPWIYTAQDGDPANQYAVFYSHMTGANVAGYIISPELTTVNGNTLSFDTYKITGPGGQVAAGAVTVQVGLVSSATSAADFQEVGTAFDITATAATHGGIILPQSGTKKYVAFKFLAATTFNGVALDNVTIGTGTVPCTAVASLNENFNAFTFTTPGTGLPQNCWSTISTGPLVYISGAAGNNYATFYASNSVNVNAYLVSPELTTLGGNYELSFDTERVLMSAPPAPGTVTIQLGTLSDNTNAATFVAFGEPIAVTGESVTHANIAITAATGQKYIAFRIIGDTAHNAALIDNVVWSEVPAPPCAAVATIDENFNEFTDLPENCWSVIAPPSGPFLGIDAEEGQEDQYVSFYSFTAVDVLSTLVTPEINTIGENYTLSFDAGMNAAGAPGAVTLQVGTLTDAADASTFTAVGTPITLSATMTTYNGITIPSDDGNFIGFQISANGSHVAAKLDNVKWTATAGTEDFNKNAFSIFPNPTANKNVTISHNIEGKGTVSVYTLTGAVVATSELSAGSQNLNLSSLSAGIYIVKIEAGNQTATKKLIVQ